MVRFSRQNLFGKLYGRSIQCSGYIAATTIFRVILISSDHALITISVNAPEYVREGYRRRISIEYKSGSFFLKSGDYKRVLSELEGEMQRLSDEMNFEKAAVLRDRIKSIKRLESKQVIVLSPDVNRDVIAYSELEGEICFSVMHLRQGKLLFQDTVFMTDNADDITGVFIERYYQQKDIIPKEIALECLPESYELLAQWLIGAARLECPLYRGAQG